MSEEQVVQTAAPAEAQEARPRKPMQKNKKKVCGFCMEKNVYIDYKDPRIKRYTTEKGKIISRRQTGLCAAHQREITVAIKRARNMSLI